MQHSAAVGLRPASFAEYCPCPAAPPRPNVQDWAATISMVHSASACCLALEGEQPSVAQIPTPRLSSGGAVPALEESQVQESVAARLAARGLARLSTVLDEGLRQLEVRGALSPAARRALEASALLCLARQAQALAAEVLLAPPGHAGGDAQPKPAAAAGAKRPAPPLRVADSEQPSCAATLLALASAAAAEAPCLKRQRRSR